MESVLHSGLACVGMGHQVEVATLDDPGATYLQKYPLPVRPLGPSRTGHAYSARYVPWLRAHACEYDAVIVHGLWQYHSYGAWMALHDLPVPYFVYTHGMLDPWFKKAHPVKHLRKLLYWPFADYRLLRDARSVLFTCEEERLLARQSFKLYKAHETVVSFGTSAPPTDATRLREVFYDKFPALRGRCLLLYLSRIHPKKGCDLLLEAFARVAAQAPELRLMIAGPDQLGWQPQLQALAAQLGIADRVVWPGMLRGDLKWGAFHASEAYLLPSHQENFGIAVAEALGCGVPVLISDKVNIWREIASAAAGIVESDTADGTERALRQWLALGDEARARMQQAASRLFANRFSAQAMGSALIDVVSLLGGVRLHQPPAHPATS